MRKYVIALYIRLSVEDIKTESLSIPNQRLILREKAMSLPEWDNGEVLEFVDNGHTGTNFERPAVQELLTMVQAGSIDCIIVKDLSRFGREYAQMGMYIENDFEDWNIRFISIGENIDTLNGTDVILMPIINVINSHYPRTKCPNSQRTNRKNRSPRKRNNQWRKNQTVDMYYKFVGIW